MSAIYDKGFRAGRSGRNPPIPYADDDDGPDRDEYIRGFVAGCLARDKSSRLAVAAGWLALLAGGRSLIRRAN